KRRAEKSKQEARMFSFKNGMQALPLALQKALKEKVITNAEVVSLAKTENGYQISYRHSGEIKSIETPKLLSTIPAYAAAELFKNFDSELIRHLNEIYHPPVFVLYLVYNKKDVKQALDGFGFLIPQKERKSFLGALWSSVIFSDRTPDDKAAFTLFIGGSRDPEIVNYDRELLLKKVKKEFSELMGITAEPIIESERFWKKAIPQYNVGYIEHEKYFEEFEKKFPGLFL